MGTIGNYPADVASVRAGNRIYEAFLSVYRSLVQALPGSSKPGINGYKSSPIFASSGGRVS